MSRLIRCWRRVLVGLMPVGLLLAACTSATGMSNNAGVAAPQGESTAVVNLDGLGATSSDDPPARSMTVNVYITDDGFQPASIFIPAGHVVKLVVRNLGAIEHHYRVQGLVPRDLLRLAKEEAVVGADEEHAAHHQAFGLVPLNTCTSRSGICPSGNEVHAYAQGGGIDAVFFTATNKGTFLVQDPLHPEIVGKVIVF